MHAHSTDDSLPWVLVARPATHSFGLVQNDLDGVTVERFTAGAGRKWTKHKVYIGRVITSLSHSPWIDTDHEYFTALKMKIPSELYRHDWKSNGEEEWSEDSQDKSDAEEKEAEPEEAKASSARFGWKGKGKVTQASAKGKGKAKALFIGSESEADQEGESSSSSTHSRLRAQSNRCHRGACI